MASVNPLLHRYKHNESEEAAKKTKIFCMSGIGRELKSRTLYRKYFQGLK